jgi:hypothetical protein
MRRCGGTVPWEEAFTRLSYRKYRGEQRKRRPARRRNIWMI